jgi:osomolarity two-component system, phosphorelay intermediate protein YPD1
VKGSWLSSKWPLPRNWTSAFNTSLTAGCCSENQDLGKLSSLGHFLKGSSATLGFVKVMRSCEEIQHYGGKTNPDGSSEADEDVCLAKITAALARVKVDYAEVKEIMQKFFDKAT